MLMRSVYNKVKELNYRTYKPLQLSRIKGLHRTRLLIVSKDIISLLNDIHVIVNDYLKQKNKSRIKIDIDPLYIE